MDRDIRETACHNLIFAQGKDAIVVFGVRLPTGWRAFRPAPMGALPFVREKPFASAFSGSHSLACRRTTPGADVFRATLACPAMPKWSRARPAVRYGPGSLSLASINRHQTPYTKEEAP